MIHSVRRNFYLFGGQTDHTVGQLELTFEEGSVQFDADSRWELRVVLGRWEDPLAEPLSQENAEFVATSGKWTAFDVSTEPEYEPLVGACVAAVDPITDVYDQIVGVALRTNNGRTLKAEVYAGDLVVHSVMSTSVRFPQMRADVIDAVRSLADRDLQERYWIRREFPNKQYYEDLHLNIHILYDDTAILPHPASGLDAPGVG